MFGPKDVKAETASFPRTVAVGLHGLNDFVLFVVVNTADGVGEPVNVEHGHIRREGNDEDDRYENIRGEFIIDAPKRLGRC